MLAGVLHWWHSNPSLSDEEMIARFYAHRAEIEELVKRYRNWEPSERTPNWLIPPENKALMEKARVRRVSDQIPVWPPNPYSIEAAKQFHSLIWSGKIKNLKPYSSIGVDLVDEMYPQKYSGSALVLAGWKVIFKGLVYFPEIPKIENEKFWWPVDGRKGYWRADRVFSTLNDYPPDWKAGECVYRQLEAQWFIYMCVSY